MQGEDYIEGRLNLLLEMNLTLMTLIMFFAPNAVDLREESRKNMKKINIPIPQNRDNCRITKNSRPKNPRVL